MSRERTNDFHGSLVALNDCHFRNLACPSCIVWRRLLIFVSFNFLCFAVCHIVKNYLSDILNTKVPLILGKVRIFSSKYYLSSTLSGHHNTFIIWSIWCSCSFFISIIAKMSLIIRFALYWLSKCIYCLVCSRNLGRERAREIISDWTYFPSHGSWTSYNVCWWAGIRTSW